MDDGIDIESSSTSMSMSESEQEPTQSVISIQPRSTLDLKKKKKKGVFQTEWIRSEPFSSWIQEVKTDQRMARCLACLKTFSVHEGKPALKKHMNTKGHKKNMKSFGNNALLTQISTSTDERKKISAVEATLVYHGVKHGHSYNSQQCTVNLIKETFGTSSTTAKKLACGRTKARAITSDVLAPYFTSKLIDELLESRFYSLSFDASNKGNIKTYPFAVQYFSNVGVKKGILQFLDDPHESAIDIFNNAIKVIEDCQLNIPNLTSIGADNANVNYGEHHSVFKLFQDIRPNLAKGNCYAHILHNGVKHGHDELSIDIELVLYKIYSHFSNSAKRTDELKSYYDFVQVEYHALVEHIAIRWLSLLRSIQRLIEDYEPIKNYFLNQQIPQTKKLNRTHKNLQLLKTVFEDDYGFCVLVFLENVLADIQRAELKLQRVSTTAVELYDIITGLISKLEQRLNDKYFGSKTDLVLNQLVISDEQKAEELRESFESFIRSVIDYINSYFGRERDLFKKLSAFNFHLAGFLTWHSLLEIIDSIKIDGLDRDELYNEYCDIKFLYEEMKNKNVNLSEQVKLYISQKNIYDGKSEKNDRIPCVFDNDVNDSSLNNSVKANELIQSDHLWAFLLNIKPNSSPNLKLVVGYVFSIPCSNAFVESIFSKMTHLWSNYRNRMDIDLVKAELQIRINSDIPCAQFHDFVLTQEELLKKIASNEKFVRKQRLDK